MHRSSDTIATIAAALAKAQVELTNPEKSLVATIRSPFPLVGIAGADDLDAPDLGAAPKPATELPRPGSQTNGQAAAGNRTAPGGGKLPESSAARSVL